MLGMLKPEKGWSLKNPRKTQDFAETLNFAEAQEPGTAAERPSSCFKGEMEQPQHWSHFGLLDPSNCGNICGAAAPAPGALSPFLCLGVCSPLLSQSCRSDSSLHFQHPQAAVKPGEPNPALHLSERGAEHGAMGNCSVLVRHGDIWR